MKEKFFLKREILSSRFLYSIFKWISLNYIANSEWIKISHSSSFSSLPLSSSSFFRFIVIINRFITHTFIKIVKRHARLKKRFVRENQAPFVKKNWERRYIVQVGYEIIFVKTPTKRMKRSTKCKKTNVCPLERKVLRNILRIFPKMVFQTKFFVAW